MAYGQPTVPSSTNRRALATVGRLTGGAVSARRIDRRTASEVSPAALQRPLQIDKNGNRSAQGRTPTRRPGFDTGDEFPQAECKFGSYFQVDKKTSLL